MDTSESTLPFGIPRTLAAIAASMFFWGLGEGLFIFFLPLTLQRWDASTVLIGAILSLIGVLMALVQLPSGILSDRFGPRPLVLGGMVLGIVSAQVMALAKTLPLFAIALLAYCSTCLINPPMNSMVTRLRGQWSVQRAMTFIGAAATIGAISGPMIGGKIADTFGLAVVFQYSTVLFAISMGVFLVAGKAGTQPVHTEVEATQQRINPLRNPHFLGLLAVVLVTIIFLSVPQQLSSLYLQDIQHVTTQQIGLMGTLSGIVTALMMLVLGNLTPSLGMFLGQLMMAGFAVLMWRGTGLVAFFAGYSLVGGYRLYHVMALAYSRSLVVEGNVGLAFGLVETGNALAMIVAPMLAGLLYDANPYAVYTVSLAALALMMVLNALFMRSKRSKRSKQPISV
jgi:MFS family permease